MRAATILLEMRRLNLDLFSLIREAQLRRLLAGSSYRVSHLEGIELEGL
jgi:hypothetical protein